MSVQQATVAAPRREPRALHRRGRPGNRVVMVAQPEPLAERGPAEENVPGLLGRVCRQARELRPSIPRFLVDHEGRPDELMNVVEVRDRVMRPSAPMGVRDRVWRWLLAQARAEGGDWYLMITYMILRVLKQIHNRLAHPKIASHEERAAIGEMLARGVVYAVHKVDLDSEHLAAKVADGAYYWGVRRPHRERDNVRRHEVIADVEAQWRAADAAEDAIPGRLLGSNPAGSAEEALHRLVHASRDAPPGLRLTRADADLIAATYLEDGDSARKRSRTLADVAAELGISVSAATSQRLRAVRKVALLCRRSALAGDLPHRP